MGMGYEDGEDFFAEDEIEEQIDDDDDEDEEEEDEERNFPDDPYDEDEDLIDGVGFADPGGRSALRAATPHNPRDQPCPTCGRKNVLTRIDVQRHYQCNHCADAAEGMGGY